MPSIAAARVVWNAWRQRGSGWLFETLRLLLASPRDFLDARFSHPKVKTMMAAWGLHLDFPPDVAGGALFPYLECMANQTFGMVIGKGGADTIVNAMTGALKARGAALVLGAPVARIDVSSGRATGVTLADGRQFEAEARGHRQRAPEARFRNAGRFRSRPRKIRTRRLGVPGRSGHDDDTPCARRAARLERRRAPEGLRLRPCRAGPRNDVAGLCRSVGRTASRRARIGRRPTHRDRPLARSGRQAYPLGAGPRPAGRYSRRRQGRDRGDELGRREARLCRTRARHPGVLRAWLAPARAGPRGLVSARSRTRKSQPDRRRQSFGEPPSRPELFPASRRRPFALQHAGKGPLSLRRPRPGPARGPAQARVSCSRRCSRDRRNS